VAKQGLRKGGLASVVSHRSRLSQYFLNTLILATESDDLQDLPQFVEYTGGRPVRRFQDLGKVEETLRLSEEKKVRELPSPVPGTIPDGS
jgi:hypothetical protein